MRSRSRCFCCQLVVQFVVALPSLRLLCVGRFLRSARTQPSKGKASRRRSAPSRLSTPSSQVNKVARRCYAGGTSATRDLLGRFRGWASRTIIMVAGEARLGASHLRAAAGPAVARCAAVRGTRSRSARLPAHREGHAMRRCASARACFVPSLLGFLHYHDDLISRVVACTVYRSDRDSLRILLRSRCASLSRWRR